jgi:hypothetical protein
MKRIGLAVAAMMVAALAFGAPPAAFAADKPKPYEKDQITKGMKEAPPVVLAAGVPCSVTNAAYIGQSTAKDDKGKDVKQDVYEVACSEGLGYGLVAPVGQTPKAYDCVALIGNASLACRLPENADPKKGLQPIVAKTGAQCTISDVRYLGSKPTGEAFYEVGCAPAPGFLLQTMKGQAPKTIGCDQVAGGAMACKFTTAEQLDAANNAKAGALLAKSGKTCQMTKSRSIGQLQSGDTAYEVACSDGSGYVLEALASGDYHTAINCANAGDSCKLTDATKAQTSESGTYTRLAKAAGFPCEVAQYRFIGMDSKSNSEVVELQCSNRKDGAVAMFPADNGPGKIYDCIAAGALGQTCKLTDPSSLYPKYTQALATKGKKSCTVSGAKWLGVTPSGDTFVETACSDGLPGWVISMTPAGSVNELLSCGQAKSAGVTCGLPGNTK